MGVKLKGRKSWINKMKHILLMFILYVNLLISNSLTQLSIDRYKKLQLASTTIS